MSTRTVAYVRVSSKGQDHKTQRDAIERAHPEVTHWYSEKLSAKTTQRPELQRVMADARAGRFDKLVVFKLDRLTRSGVTDTFKVVEELRQAAVTLVAVADNVTIKPDKNDIVSDVMVFALGLATRLEWVARNDRIAAARVRMEAKGEAWGRPRKTKARDVERVNALRSEGKTVAEVAKVLHVSRATVHRLLASAK